MIGPTWIQIRWISSSLSSFFHLFFFDKSANLSSVLEEIKRDKTEVTLNFPFVYVEPLSSLNPSLLCVSCKKPAVSPVLKGDLLICSPCLVMEIGGTVTAGISDVKECPEETRKMLDSLEVRCPFPPCEKIVYRKLMQYHVMVCPHVFIPCPLSDNGCEEVFKRTDEAFEHFFVCKMLKNEREFLIEQRGDFHVLGKDMIQVILLYLEPADAIALSCVNRWFRDRVRESYSYLLCKHCGFFHHEPLYYHQGKWNDLSFFDINHHRKSTFAMRDKISVAATGGKKAAAVTAVALGGGIVGAVVATPLFLLGVLLKSSDIIATSISIPVRMAAACGGAVYDAYNPKAVLTGWSCCEREGSYAKPCKLCTGFEVVEIPDDLEVEEQQEQDLQNGLLNNNN